MEKKYRKICNIAVIIAIVLMSSLSAISVSAAPAANNQYVVAQDGTGDFITIQQAVDNASDGDTIVIYPGTYTESVEVMSKSLNLVGISRDLCIIRCDTSSYRKAPLTISSGGVSNLTIYGMDTGIPQPQLTEEEIAAINASLIGDSWDRQKNYAGYAVHVDQNYMYGRSLSFENCRIISENNHCVGIGTRGKSTVSFTNCQITSTGGGSCIFMHDPTSKDVSGKGALVVKNCQLTSYMCPYVMTFQSLLPEYNTMEFTFQNVNVKAVSYAYSDSYVPLNVNTWFEVETLLTLEKTGSLYAMGLKNTQAELVHELSREETRDYMNMLSESMETHNTSELLSYNLLEGITYIGKDTNDEGLVDLGKHQVIAIYNSGNIAGSGWCGLDNAYLTADSFGNTLPEMNSR